MSSLIFETAFEYVYKNKYHAHDDAFGLLNNLVELVLCAKNGSIRFMTLLFENIVVVNDDKRNLSEK